ncbi:hypothetical protein KI387_011706, partial [Taxus chinensis]
ASLQNVESIAAGRMSELMAKDREVDQIKRELRDTLTKQALTASQAEVKSLATKLTIAEAL